VLLAALLQRSINIHLSPLLASALRFIQSIRYLMNMEELPCADKLVYDSKKEAQAAATALNYQKGSQLRPYKCRHCQLWHLTSQ